MKKVYEILGLDDPIKGQWGIEVEAEGNNLQIANPGFWRSEDDNSLRGRFPGSRHEWVLSAPILLKDVEKAVQELADRQKNAELNFSFRTSVHVHMNVQELTFAQLTNILYTYLLLEEPLITFCGDSRRGNRFCLRLRDAEGLMGHITKMFTLGDSGIKRIDPDAIRYAAINLEAIRKYGSIEFRGMRGTLDVKTITTWVNLLNCIKEFSKKFEDVEAIHQHFRIIGADAFLKEVFGKYADAVNGDFERDINYSYSLSLDLPYAYKAYKERPKEAPKKDVFKIKNFKIPVIEPGQDFEQWKVIVREGPVPLLADLFDLPRAP